MEGKIKDLVFDLSKLDQEADICIADEWGWGRYNPLKIKKIYRPNVYKGYLIQGIPDRHERGEIPCEHLESQGGKVKDILADLLKLNQEEDLCIADALYWTRYNPLMLKKIDRPTGYKGYLIQGVFERTEKGEVECEHLSTHKIDETRTSNSSKEQEEETPIQQVQNFQIDKVELLQQFYKETLDRGISLELDLDQVLREFKYKPLHLGDEDIIEAILVYCLWNRNYIRRIKDRDYEYYRKILVDEGLLKSY